MNSPKIFIVVVATLIGGGFISAAALLVAILVGYVPYEVARDFAPTGVAFMSSLIAILAALVAWSSSARQHALAALPSLIQERERLKQSWLDSRRVAHLARLIVTYIEYNGDVSDVFSSFCGQFNIKPGEARNWHEVIQIATKAEYKEHIGSLAYIMDTSFYDKRSFILRKSLVNFIFNQDTRLTITGNLVIQIDKRIDEILGIDFWKHHSAPSDGGAASAVGAMPSNKGAGAP